MYVAGVHVQEIIHESLGLIRIELNTQLENDTTRQPPYDRYKWNYNHNINRLLHVQPLRIQIARYVLRQGLPRYSYSGGIETINPILGRGLDS